MSAQRENRSVYVSNLPDDVSEEELLKVFRKCGLLMINPATNREKIKIYLDERGKPKGDAIVTFFKSASVPLAITLLDDTELRPGHLNSKIKVEEAIFSKKDDVERPVEEPVPKEKLKHIVNKMEKQLEWYDESEAQPNKRAKRYGRIVVLERMFLKSELDEDPALLIDLKLDVQEECESIGTVTNVKLFETSGDRGIMSVKFQHDHEAKECVKVMDGRYFGGRKIKAYIYDGKADLSLSD